MLGVRTAASIVVIVMVLAGVTAAGDTRLIEAVKNRRLEDVRALLKQRVDVNATQGDKATALHWAVRADDAAMVGVLLGAGARADLADDTGVTPLYLACLNRNARMVETLLEAGANPNAALAGGETVLMTCSRTGEPAAVRALLARGAAVNAKEPAHQQTALMWAASESHSPVVAALLERGADVRARSRIYTQTVTSEVTQRAGREELNYTVPRGGSSALLFAARSGDRESARLLIAAGADVDDALPDGASALIVAAHSGHGQVAALLLEAGADPNRDTVGYTALHAAVLRSDLALVEALLTRGANPNAPLTRGTPVRRNSQDFELPKTLLGATPYLLAARFLEPDIMRALAAAGADTHQPMKDGATPLMAAAGIGIAAAAQDEKRGTNRRGLAILDGGTIEPESRVRETVTAALTLGSNIDAVNPAGDTALHVAAAHGYDSVVALLARSGANVNVRNARGLTALGALTRGANGKTGADGESPRQSTIDLLRTLGATD
ncbi:MAG TPA: ankyrin repeat domain-containing protein [Vicinamibacterales bacterium]|nr:ankyrin repeat domain-containing protein [Vicinamibacterales bacterium]